MAAKKKSKGKRRLKLSTLINPKKRKKLKNARKKVFSTKSSDKIQLDFFYNKKTAKKSKSILRPFF